MPAGGAVRGRRVGQRTKSSIAVPLPPQPTEEQIRQRAYEIYLARGGKPGNPDWDWYQAELELKARLALLGKP